MKKYFFAFIAAISITAIATSANYSNRSTNSLQKRVITDTIPDTSGHKQDTTMRDSLKLNP
jgi:hypothetical protein